MKETPVPEIPVLAFQTIDQADAFFTVSSYINPSS